ncbi:MAG: phosphoserine phosphatase SerB [Alphaproteobacteria bacterium]|nr:phosphoserine phosphatase SerB [Alphaproteobacteria bacterium]
MEHVLTLIASSGTTLGGDAVAAVTKALGRLGADVGSRIWLARDQACDLTFANLSCDQADAAARRVLGPASVDVLAQPLAGRRKQILVADMDSTFIAEETLDELAALVGIKDKVAAITARAMNGELDFAKALRERVAMLAGLSTGALEETWQQMNFVPGGRTLVRTMVAAGATCVLVSGGFKFFTSRVRDACGFDLDVANDLEIENGALTGRVIEPIVDRNVKLQTLKQIASDRNVPLRLTASVGDGANDLPMLQASGLGVAFHARPAGTAAAPHRIDHGDLRTILFAQGYKAAEFID